MPSQLFKTKNNVTLLGAAPADDTLLALSLKHAPDLVCADGGADTAKRLGYTPLAIFGDLDSITKLQVWQNSDTDIYELLEQDTTDFEKSVGAIDAQLILCVGFTGGRLDHELAALTALWRAKDRRLVMLSESDLCFHWSNDIVLELEEGTRVSFHPLQPVQGIGSSGLKWALDGLRLAPDGLLGTSNAATGSTVRAQFDRDGVLVFLPLDCLEQVLAVLARR